MLEGGCLCGAVRYRATGTPFDATNCHCRTCRRASGAPFVSWVTFRADEWTIVAGEPRRYGSSPGVERSFCGTCGTQLTYRREDSPTEIDVTIASLDDPDQVVPQDHTWTRHRISWVPARDSLPVYPESRPGG